MWAMLYYLARRCNLETSRGNLFVMNTEGPAKPAKPRKPRQRPNNLSVDLKDMKEAWLAWCTARDVKPGDAIRQVVSRVLSQKEQGRALVRPSFVVAPSEDGATATHRVRVRLSPADYNAAASLAAQEGFGLPKWITALAIARVTKGPMFGQQELEALAQSNLRLLGIGRNLNQIAKTLNAHPDQVDAVRMRLLEDLRAMIREHTTVVSALVAANTDRWRQ